MYLLVEILTSDQALLGAVAVLLGFWGGFVYGKAYVGVVARDLMRRNKQLSDDLQSYRR